MQVDQQEERAWSYRAVADGQEAVLHRALPLLPHFPQSEDETRVIDTLLILLNYTNQSLIRTHNTKQRSKIKQNLTTQQQCERCCTGSEMGSGLVNMWARLSGLMRLYPETAGTHRPVQRCVLSPLLYILHTSDCGRKCDGRNLLKFTDDTV